MSRPRIQLNTEELMDIAGSGASKKDMADHFNVSTVTLSKRIQEVENEQGVILDFKRIEAQMVAKATGHALTSILTELENDNIAPENLPKLYEILSRRSDTLEGRTESKEIKGLVGLLIRMEEEHNLKKAEVIDVGDSDRLPENLGRPRIEL